MIRITKCPCGNYEEYPLDEQRCHTANFEWIENYPDGTALESYNPPEQICYRIQKSRG